MKTIKEYKDDYYKHTYQVLLIILACAVAVSIVSIVLTVIMLAS